jgi:hypothetical protein
LRARRATSSTLSGDAPAPPTNWLPWSRRSPGHGNPGQHGAREQRANGTRGRRLCTPRKGPGPSGSTADNRYRYNIPIYAEDEMNRNVRESQTLLRFLSRNNGSAHLGLEGLGVDPTARRSTARQLSKHIQRRTRGVSVHRGRMARHTPRWGPRFWQCSTAWVHRSGARRQLVIHHTPARTCSNPEPSGVVLRTGRVCQLSSAGRVWVGVTGTSVHIGVSAALWHPPPAQHSRRRRVEQQCTPT